ncbi:MAG TPA: MFS transporter [Streptosporangiaceae bacterium]|nr:MFS transporter [Streptosporangiaceae bacterium]
MAVARVRELPGDKSAPQAAGQSQLGQRRRLVFAVVSIALFMASVDQTIVATALGSLQRDLHAPVNWSSWTITIYALGQIIAMPAAGTISDMYGRKKVFLGAIVLFTVASLCCGLANDIYVLVALRAAQALGGGAFTPSATGIVSDQFGPDRDRAIGLFSSVFPIGGIVGPVLGGLFVTYWSWRGIFLVNVPLGIALFCLAIVFLPSGTKKSTRRLDLLGIGLLASGLLGVMLAVSYLGSSTASALSVPFILPLMVGAGALVLFVRHATRAEAPFVPLRLLAGREFATMNVINFLIGTAILGFGALVPLYAQERYHLSSLAAGTLLTARAVGMISVAALATFALRRTGYRLPMIVGLGIAATGLTLMSVSPLWLTPYGWLTIVVGLTGIGIGMALPASNNATLQRAPENTAAVAGLRGMFRQSGGITGIALITAVVARSADPGHALAYAFGVLAFLLVCLLPAVFLISDHRGQW